MIWLAVPAAAAPPAASDLHPEIWRGARAGMTIEQVQELFPKGRAAAVPAPTTGAPPDQGVRVAARTSTTAVGALPVWSMDETIYGRDGVATFYFQSGRLVATLVSLEKIKAHGTQANLDAARDLARDLSGYYGKPKDCVDVDRHGLARMDCRWSAGRLDVGLSYLDYGGASSTLNVSVRLQSPKPPETGAAFKAKGRKIE